MREPRHILLRARAAASARAERLRQRLLAPHAAVPLDEVRRRLELLLAALHGRVIHIDAAEPPSRRSRLERIVSPEPRHLRHEEALPSTDGERIRLPASLRAEGGADDAMARYRLLALEQGERVARGTAALAPGEDDALARDLYLLREAAAVDAALARAMPSLAPALAARRAEALAHRPPLDGLTPAEREAERLVRRLLAAGPAAPPAEIGGDGAPADSRAWAEEAAARVRAAGGGYRGLAPVPLWGVVTAPAATAPAPRPRSEPPLPTTGPDIDIAPIERYRPGDAPGEGAPATPATESRRPQVEAREGAPVRAAGTGAADESRDRADAQPAAPLHPAAEPPAVLHPEDEASRVVEEREAQLGELVVEYPEWDYARERHRPRAATVREQRPAEGDASWAAGVLARHAALARGVRARFEPMRARRLRLGGQRDGEELDLAACVRSMVEWRAGHGADDRLYVAVRPARRGLAILLLVDVSGSTDALVTGAEQVIDVEKVALLLASEAFDALGDRYAILTFSSRGARDVRLTTLKDFAERNGETVRRRIAAVAPEGNTRLGAAVRHATALLVGQPAGHRLLLILSDGKPNDADQYQGRYAVEDSRQAILEARAQGVYPFCLTIDREEPEYLEHIFGAAGHTILRQAEHLPMALLRAVRQLIAG